MKPPKRLSSIRKRPTKPRWSPSKARSLAASFNCGFDPKETCPDEITDDIPYNAKPEEVQAALEALPSINPGDVEVSLGESTGRWLVTFTGQYAGKDMPLMRVTNSLAQRSGRSDRHRHDLLGRHRQNRTDPQPPSRRNPHAARGRDDGRRALVSPDRLRRDLRRMPRPRCCACPSVLKALTCSCLILRPLTASVPADAAPAFPSIGR